MQKRAPPAAPKRSASKTAQRPLHVRAGPPCASPYVAAVPRSHWSGTACHISGPGVRPTSLAATGYWLCKCPHGISSFPLSPAGRICAAAEPIASMPLVLYPPPPPLPPSPGRQVCRGQSHAAPPPPLRRCEQRPAMPCHATTCCRSPRRKHMLPLASPPEDLWGAAPPPCPSVPSLLLALVDLCEQRGEDGLRQQRLLLDRCRQRRVAGRLVVPEALLHAQLNVQRLPYSVGRAGGQGVAAGRRGRRRGRRASGRRTAAGVGVGVCARSRGAAARATRDNRPRSISVVLTQVLPHLLPCRPSAAHRSPPPPAPALTLMAATLASPFFP